MVSLPRSELRSSQGHQSRPTITPRPLRAARAVRRVRVVREQRRKKAPQTGNTVACRFWQFKKQRLFCICWLTKNSVLPMTWRWCLFAHLHYQSVQSQGCRHWFSQHYGGSRRRRRGGRWRASWRLWGSDNAGAEGESSVYVMMLKMHCDLMENSMCYMTEY